jgi:parvulin-like peptidyl-prolyl isomerase
MHILTTDQQKAWWVRNKVEKESFLDLAKNYSIDPVGDPEKTPFVSANEMIPELAAVAFNIRTGGTTNPIKTSRGFYIIRIIDKQPPESVRSLAELREEIMNLLTAEQQKRQLEQLVENLKSTLPVETNYNILPGQTDSLSVLPEQESYDAEPSPQ